MLLDYVATYPDAIICYHASDMVLHVDSDAAYLAVLPNACSRYAAGHFFLGDTPPPAPAKPSPKPNGAIITNCKTIRGVMASAAETETGGVFGNAQDAIVVHIALLALGHKKQPHLSKQAIPHATVLFTQTYANADQKHGTCARDPPNLLGQREKQ